VGSKALVEAAEREALATLERLANGMDAQPGPASAGILYNYDRTASHGYLSGSRKCLPTLYSGPTEREVSGHPLPCGPRETDHYNPLIFSVNGKGSSLRWLR